MDYRGEDETGVWYWANFFYPTQRFCLNYKSEMNFSGSYMPNPDVDAELSFVHDTTTCLTNDDNGCLNTLLR